MSLQGQVQLLARSLTAFATKDQGLQTCCTLYLKLLTLRPQLRFLLTQVSLFHAGF